MNITTIKRLVMVLACSLSLSGQAVADTPKKIDVPAGQLIAALKALGAQSGVEFVYSTDQLQGLSTKGAHGELTAEQALTKLLEGTNLKVTTHESGALLISAGNVPVKTSDASNSAGVQPVQMAQANASSSSTASAQGVQGQQGTEDAGVDTQEIIVTATKRAQRLQDVPLSITAITSEEIDRRGLTNAADYLRGIPGVNQVDTALNQTIVIRGIESATAFQNVGSGPTTATYFGETPTTNAAGLFGGTNVDLKLVDIERVEVLRGPQGTAFGSSSMGGAVRTIPVAPQLNRFDGKVSTEYSMTSGAGGDNYNAHAVANLPLVQDKLALRATVYQFEDSGYYQNRAGSNSSFQAAAAGVGAQAFAIDQDEVGGYFTRGGRIAALFQATEDLKFNLSYLTQKTEADGVVGARGDNYQQTEFQISPEHARAGLGAGYANTDIDILSASLENDFSWATVLATFSYLDGGSTSATNIVTFPASQYADSQHREYVGEIRLTTQLEGPWNFLAGLYAENVKDNALADNKWYADPLQIIVPPGPRSPLDLGVYLERRRLEQRAAFGEAAWELAPGLTLTGGVRAYQYDRSYKLDADGGFYGALGIHEDEKGDDSGVNYRANLSYAPSKNALLFVGWSQGFRLGRLQPGLGSGQCDVNGDNIVDGTNIPIAVTGRVLDPDELDSFEVGGKFSFLDNRVIISADVFRMKWSKMPVRVTPIPANAGGTCAGLSYFANLGDTTSDGVEVEAKFRVSAPLTVVLGGSWIDATLDEDEPGLGATEGTRMPGAPKVNANLGVEYEFTLGGYEAFVRADSIYVGDFSSILTSDPLVKPTVEAGDYFKLDATARVAIRNLSIELYARNLTNDDGFTYSESVLNRYQMRPRTFGLQLAYDFGGR